LRKARSVSGDRRQCAGPISVHSRESGNPGAEKLDQRSRFRASARIFELYANAACGWAERCHSVPSPHVGEGQGYNRHGIFCYRRPTNAAPSVLASWVFAQEYLCARCFIATPLPVPPPHGGREPCGTHLRNSLLCNLRCVHALARKWGPRAKRNDLSKTGSPLPRGRTENVARSVLPIQLSKSPVQCANAACFGLRLSLRTVLPTGSVRQGRVTACQQQPMPR
jgi:hypothetical protein